MANKKSTRKSTDTQVETKSPRIQRPAAERLYADQLALLREKDAGMPKPEGWQLTPRSVLAFVMGDPQRDITPKFVGRRSFLERCIVSLATNRGLMLIGEPGTAKSYLSELLAAAISGDSTLTIQGSAGTTEDNIKYSWNYALLVAQGPSEEALVPAPLYQGMKHGKIVRFEEITRCPLEIQDTLLSVLSDRVLMIPELDCTTDPESSTLFSRSGFNVIATANTRDRGVNDMSAALKRRFNFETVHPIRDINEEMALVQRETNRLLDTAGVPISMTPELTELLVTTFRDLREGTTREGKGIEPLTTVMSTAEAIGTAYSAAIHAYYYDEGKLQPANLVQHLAGTVLKDSEEDIKRLRHYFDHVTSRRSGNHWKAYYDARNSLE